MQNYAYDDLGQLLTWTRFPGTGSQAAEVYAYDSVGNRVGLSYQNYLGATTSWRTYDIGRRTDTSKGPNQLLKSLGRNAMVVFNYNTFGYDPDGAQVERKLYTGSNMLIESETFGYSSWRGLNTGYAKSTSGPFGSTLNWEWRYRYNAMGEREQKRETLHPGLDSTASNGYKWSYYLLGGSKEQLSLWEGLQTRDASFCSHPGSGSYVHLYPSEYLVYGVEYPGVREDVPRLRLLPDSSREYRITDHLASVRATLDETGTITKTYEYKPFGGLFMGSGEARQSFNSREKDQETGTYNNGVRKLDDDEARFTSIDPLWEKFRAWSPYQYGYNNPLTVTDPGGMQGESIWPALSLTDPTTYPNFNPMAYQGRLASNFLLKNAGEAIGGKYVGENLLALSNASAGMITSIGGVVGGGKLVIKAGASLGATGAGLQTNAGLLMSFGIADFGVNFAKAANAVNNLVQGSSEMPAEMPSNGFGVILGAPADALIGSKDAGKGGPMETLLGFGYTLVTSGWSMKTSKTILNQPIVSVQNTGEALLNALGIGFSIGEDAARRRSEANRSTSQSSTAPVTGGGGSQYYENPQNL